MHSGSSITSKIGAGDPSRAPREALVPPVAGLLLIDVPFWYDRRKPVRAKTIQSYYGSDAEEVWGVSRTV